MGIMEVIWGLYWDNGKENGSYYLGFRACAKVLRRFKRFRAQGLGFWA